MKFLMALFLLVCTSSLMANEVLKWNSLLLQAIKINKTPPPIAARNLAILHTAIFDTANSLSSQYQPYQVKISPKGKLFSGAALAQSAAYVLEKIYPQQALTWESELAITKAIYPSGPQLNASLNLGLEIAKVIWTGRSNDLNKSTLNQDFDSVGFTDIGIWIPTPPKFDPGLLPNWGLVKPFGLQSGSQFRQSGPPAFSSKRYAKDYNEVLKFGLKDLSSRTDEETLIAKFWADGSGTVTPPGHWNVIAQGISSNKKLSLLETSRLFALLNIALADAGISAWDMKYTYNCWRPITAISEGSADENPNTEVHNNWEPLLTTPPFPDYVSGHSTFSSAAATILENFFESDKMHFTTHSDDLPGVSRTFTRFSQAAYEAGRSRIFGGIHFEFANKDGARAGRMVGDYVYSHLLLKLN